MMTTPPVSRNVERILHAMQPFLDEMPRSPFARRTDDRSLSDFMAGNSQEMTLAGFVASLT